MVNPKRRSSPKNRKWNWQAAHKHKQGMTLVAREHDTVSWMIGNTHQFEILTHEQSTDLFKRYKRNGEHTGVSEAESKRAHDLLVASNLKLVIAIAKGYKRSGLDFEDLLQEGNLGLMKAVEKFKWEKGYKFSTYATWWIRQAVSQFVMKRARTVRLPAHAIGVSRKMDAIKADYKKKFGEEPTDEELSELMDVSTSIVKATSNAARRTLSLSTPLDRDSDDGDTLGDTVVDPNPANNPFEAFAAKEAAQMVERSFAKLTPKEDMIVRLRFGIGNVDDEQFRVTDEEVDEIKSRGEGAQ